MCSLGKFLLTIFILFSFFNGLLCQNDNNDEEIPPIDFKKNGIIMYNEKTYKKIKENKETVAILIYSDYCDHCHAMAPEWIKFAGKVQKEKKQNPEFPFKVGVLNGENCTQLAEEKEIEVYPSIYFFKDGEKIIYAGDRTTNALWSKAERILYGNLRTLDSLKEVEKIQKNSEIYPLIMLCTIDPNTSDEKRKEEYKSFIDFVKYSEENQLEHNLFLNCFSNDCVEKYPQKVVYLRNFDEPLITLENKPINIETLKELDTNYRTKIGGRFTEELTEYVFNFERKAIIFFIDEKNETQKEMLKIFLDLGKEKREKYMSFIVDPVHNKATDDLICDYFGVDPNDAPTFCIATFSKDDGSQHYKFPLKEKEFTKENLLKFIKDYEYGKLKPEVRTQATPKEQYEDYPFKVVGKTFQKEVLDSNQTVILLTSYNLPIEEKGEEEQFKDPFYAAMDLFSENKTLLFAEIDIEANDVPSLEDKEIAYRIYVKGNKQNPIIFKKEDWSKVKNEEVLNWIKDSLDIPELPKEKPEEEETKEDNKEKKKEKKKDKSDL